MAISLVGQQPLAASGFPTEYDAAQNALTKKRHLAEMLQQQAFTPTAPLTVPGARMSWLDPVAKMVQAYTAGSINRDADEEEKKNAAARMSALTDMLNNPPPGTAAVPAIPGTPDIPAQPAANAMFGPTPDQGTSPLAASLAAPPPPDGGPPQATGGGIALAQKLLAANAPPVPPPDSGGGPASAANIMQGGPPTIAPKPLTDASGTPFMLPQRGATDLVPGLPGTPGVPAKPATPQDWLAYGAKLSTLGPTAAKIGEQITGSATGQMLPKSIKDRYMLAGNGDILDLQAEGGPAFLPGSPMAALKQTDLAQNRADQLQARADAAKQRSEDMRYSVDQRAEAAAQHNALMRELAAGRQANAVQSATTAGYTPDNQRVVTGKDGTAHVIGADGLPKKEAYAGEIIPAATKEKETTDTAAARTHLATANDLVDTITKNPKSYGTAPTIGSSIPGVGPWISEAALTSDQRQARARIAAQSAEITKRLYGSAFSAGEQLRAAPFIVLPTDPYDVAVDKLKNMQELAQQAVDRKSTVSQAASAARAPGASSPAGGRTPAQQAAMDKYGIK